VIECLELPNFRYLYYSGGEAEIDDRYREAHCRFKLIPITGGESMDTRLVRVKQDNSGQQWSDIVCLEEVSQLPYKSIGTNDGAAAARVVNFVRANYKTGNKIYTSIENATDYIIVLEKAFSSGRYYYENTVWLPNQGWMGIGTSGTGIISVYKLTFYSLNDGNHEAEKRVRQLLCLLPQSGNLGLNPSGAKPAFHVIVRVENSIASSNKISVLQFNVGDGKADVRSLEQPRETYNDLDRWVTTSGNENLWDFQSVKVHARIEKKDDCDSHVNFKRK